MASTSKVYAKRYAKQVFDEALKKKELNEWQCELKKLTDLVKDAALLALLQDPEISFGRKAEVLSQRCCGIKPKTVRLISVLVNKDKLDLIPDISEEYQRLLNRYHGMEEAEIVEVTTAVPLDNEEQLRLAQHLTDMFGKPTVLKPKVDTSLIGGIIIRVGDELIDGSIRSKLETMKRGLV